MNQRVVDIFIGVIIWNYVMFFCDCVVKFMFFICFFKFNFCFFDMLQFERIECKSVFCMLRNFLK